MQEKSDKTLRRIPTGLKTDFLAAYQTILFSKRNVGNDPDVERRRLAVKYLTARIFESEDTAALLLGEGSKRYETSMEKSKVLEKINCPDNKSRKQWKSGLGDVEQAVSLIKPAPRRESSRGRRDRTDRDVDKVMKISQDSTEERSMRKTTVPRGTIVPRRSDEEFDRQNSSHRRYQSDRSRDDSRVPRHGAEDGHSSRKQEPEDPRGGLFRTARTELQMQQRQKAGKKSLGGKGANSAANSKFVCPLKRERDRDEEVKNSVNSGEAERGEIEDERLKGIDEKLIELVRNEIMEHGATVTWDDVAGLEHAKKIIKEIVVLPMLRPDIFTGLRRPPKGILLFGPPGTGKTLIGKCIASQSKSTFFSISASSLTSKWIGESEKMVRALFAVARVHQPSVIFIDEIDSLLTQRSESEHESSRRIKTEFLVQLDGAATGEEDRILVIGATNRPQELDEAARRRFVKRLYVPLPEFEARRQIVRNLLAAEEHDLTDRDIDNIANLSEHYSGADMTNLCKEASMGPIRNIPFDLLENIRKEDVGCVTAEDFKQALTHVRPSVSQNDLGLYVEWDRTYGSGNSSSKPPTII